MKSVLISCAIIVLSLSGFAQGPASRIFDTEKAFEKTVAEKGIKAGFIEFMAPAGVIFRPGPINARESWANRPESPAALTWNPIRIEVASNEVLAYSIGNSIFRPNGKDDPNAFYGHYISVWMRQPNGEYRAVLDTGIGHDKPASMPTEWKVPSDSGIEKNERKLSAADSSTGFWETAEKMSAAKAYKSYLADDAIVMRDGKQPFFGKNAALDHIKEGKGIIRFSKRKSFIEAADLAYVYNGYLVIDKTGTEIERGNFVQVWKLRKGKWLIAADVWVPIPKQQA